MFLFIFYYRQCYLCGTDTVFIVAKKIKYKDRVNITLTTRVQYLCIYYYVTIT